MDRRTNTTVISLLAIGMLSTVVLANSANPTFRTFANPDIDIDGLMSDSRSEVWRVTSLSRSAL